MPLASLGWLFGSYTVLRCRLSFSQMLFQRLAIAGGHTHGPFDCSPVW